MGKVLSPVLGPVFGGRQKNVTTTSGPPDYMQPYLSDAAQKAKDAYGATPDFQGDPSWKMAQGLMGKTLQGDYLFPKEQLEAAARQILPQVDSSFERAGRFGSPLAQGAIAEGFGNAAANIFGQERARQQQAMFGLPEFMLSPLQKQGMYSNILRNLSIGGTQTQPYFRPPAITSALGGAGIGAGMGGPIGGAIGGGLGLLGGMF